MIDTKFFAINNPVQNKKIKSLNSIPSMYIIQKSKKSPVCRIQTGSTPTTTTNRYPRRQSFPCHFSSVLRPIFAALWWLPCSRLRCSLPRALCSMERNLPGLPIRRIGWGGNVRSIVQPIIISILPQSMILYIFCHVDKKIVCEWVSHWQLIAAEMPSYWWFGLCEE